MHWKAPSIMWGAFVAGTAFAIGHHFFYSSLHQKAVSSTTFDQQINIGAGTAFAFLVKSCLVVAVGTAFVQVLWRCLTAKPASIARIDSVTQLLTSFTELFNLRTLIRYPLLTFLAVVSWTLPLAAIVPPATLPVVTSHVPVCSSGFDRVPNLDFANLSCAETHSSIATNESPTTTINFGGSSQNMTIVAFSVALSASIPRLSPPSPNSSYAIQFYGPSLQCTETSVTILDGFSSALGCNITEPRCMEDYTFLSWVPGELQRVPFDNTSVTDGIINFGNTRSGGYSNNEPAAIYIASSNYESGWSVLNCSLFNASYDVLLSYDGGYQSLHIARERLNSVPYQSEVSHSPCTQYESCNPTIYMTAAEVAYMGVMDSFGRIMVGGSGKTELVFEDGTDVFGTFFPLLGFVRARTNGGRSLETATYVAQGLEQLFENITVGLLANTVMFTSNVNSSASSMTNVTYVSYPNIYIYNWHHLIPSYGLAVLFTTICVIIGCYSIFSSGQSFSFTFSTIARVTRDPAWNRLIRIEDMDGVDPLPKHMSKAKVPVGSLAVILPNRPMDPEYTPMEHGEVVQIHDNDGMDGEELRRLMSPRRKPVPNMFERPSASLR